MLAQDKVSKRTICDCDGDVDLFMTVLVADMFAQDGVVQQHQHFEER